MSVCACGRTTNEGRTACDRCEALTSFGLTRDANPLEIKDAYRVLAKVWHPDRFHGDEDLRRKAEEKLKEINSAYQLLTTTSAGDAYTEPNRPTPRPEYQPSPAAASGRDSYQGPSTRPVDASFVAKRPTHNANKKLIAITTAILIAAGVWITLRYLHPARWDFGSATRQTGSLVNDISHADAARNGADRADSSAQGSKENQGANVSGRPAEKKAAHTRTNAASSDRASLVLYPDEDPQVAYFTVGSTKSDVIRVQGRPDRIGGNVFEYGGSKVYFENGRVESWRMDPGSPLKAQLP